MAIAMDFGYYPQCLDFRTGDIVVSTLDGLNEAVKNVSESNLVERDWCYAPGAKCEDILSGVVRTLPYSARVFGLPNTHRIEHRTTTDIEHMRFLIWVFGFIQGVRLTDTEARFLDATPIKPGTLHDIVWLDESDQKALGLATLNDCDAFRLNERLR